MSKSIAIVLNCSSHSHRAAQQRKDLAALIEKHGLDAEMFCAEKGRHITELAQKAARSEARIVVAGGGDGTMNAVASALVGTGKTMGVLPLGTLNHFSKHLGIPQDLEDAVRVLADGQPVLIDLGEVNGHIFVNNSTLGLYPSIVLYRERLQKRHNIGKWLAFTWAILTLMYRRVFLQVRLLAEGVDSRYRTPFLFVGNNEYKLGGLDLGTRTTFDAGNLGVLVAHPSGHLWRLRLALNALIGNLAQAKDFDVLTSSELWVESPHRKLKVATDGEILTLAPPLRYRSRPQALAVLVPRAVAPAGELPAEIVPESVPSTP